MSKSDAPLIEVEHIKARSQRLRGTIAQGLLDQTTGALADDDTQLTKFHGFYQQDDRDLRAERKKQKLEPLYSFMLRARVPGGVATPKQWLAIDKIARDLTGGTLRLTTRQTFQYHGIFKHNIKPLIQGINEAMIDSIAACGDVNRNVLCNTNPVQSDLHQETYEWAVKISEHLLPKTRAYHEIWLDEEKVAGNDDAETMYGESYLPRKFKIAIAVPPHNDVDIYANDLGFIAIAEQGKLVGFNVMVGGGMGNTHGDTATYPRLGSLLGFVGLDDVLAVAEAVITTQRDYGDRTNRRHARLKYTVDSYGVDFFREEVAKRAGITFADNKPFEFTMHSDRFGWVKGIDDQWHLTLFLENGRIVDKPGREMMTGLRKIAEVHQGDFRMTATQNLIIAGVPEAEKSRIEGMARQYGLLGERITPLRENSMACVALPTCTLAMAEAERYLPSLISKFEGLMTQHNLADDTIVVRMTGCPNGCARPFLAEIGMVGKGPGTYNLYLGGDGKGMRLNKLYRENINETEILSEVDTLLGQYAAERHDGERFGDFAIRAGLVAEVKEGRFFHD